MLAYTYIKQGKFELIEKPKPELRDSRDAIVRVTLGSICTSDLHIKHGGVPRAVPGITVGHEMVGIVEQTGRDVKLVKPGDRVTVNVETFCGECFFCRHRYVNNCADPNGGWALGCRIDGGQTEYVRVPYADQGLNLIPDSVSDEQALFVGDILATGFWAARISEITEEDTVLIIGAGPTGICTLLCVLLHKPKRIIVCEKSEERRRFVQEHYPEVLLTGFGMEDAHSVANSLTWGPDGWLYGLQGFATPSKVRIPKGPGRLYRKNELASSLSELYRANDTSGAGTTHFGGYDGLNRLAAFHRGVLNADVDGIASGQGRSETFGLDGGTHPKAMG